MDSRSRRTLESARKALTDAVEKIDRVLVRDDALSASDKPSRYGITVRPGRDEKRNPPQGKKRGSKGPVSNGMGRDGKQRRK